MTNNLTLQGLVPLKLLELRLPKITLLIVIKNRIQKFSSEPLYHICENKKKCCLNSVLKCTRKVNIAICRELFKISFRDKLVTR